MAPSHNAVDLPEARALLAALPWAAELIRHPGVAAAWSQPSSLAGYTIGGLAGHIYRAVERIDASLEPHDGEGEPAQLTDWYLQNRFDDETGLDDPLAAWLRDDGEAQAEQGPGPLADSLDGAAARLATRLAGDPADRFVRAVRTGRPVPIDQYLATRVVELVVHGDDLVAGLAASDRPFPPPPVEAVDVTFALLLRGARDRSGDTDVLRAFTRAERVTDPADVLRVL